MKKNVILMAISFLAALSLLPGAGYRNTPGRAAARPDIWVYRGYYAYFEGGRARLESSDIEELRGSFVSGTGSSGGAGRIDAGHPLSGRLDACDMFVLDGTELYFRDAELPVGGLYGFCGLDIMSGSLDVSAVSAAGGLLVAPDTALTVSGEINTGGAVECFGGSITAGGINSGGVWLDSAEAPLTVTVSGSVFTGFYTQCGGSVTIGGGLYCRPPGARYGGALLTVNSEYAKYNAAYLHVRGDVVSLGKAAGVEVGGGSGYGGYDEAALRAFEAERSDHKGARRGAYDASVPASDVTFVVGGELRSLGSAVFYEGVSG